MNINGILLRSGGSLAYLKVEEGRSLIYGRRDLGSLGDENTISKEQLTLTISEGQVWIFDGNAADNRPSHNGTWVNGKKVAYSPIRAGDQLRFGKLTCQVVGAVVDF